ncbi:acetyl-CoA carboxylase biotin carboxyl carrier protein subunit [Yeosuana marina]|uniref:acetyl-CoA carboxylase biotin carboxyl carrier protein subunit n=1 Tax=Yeosuana marina TaxID=1565536 RepID=UPI003C6EB3E0|tara:strand:- start:7807 stop:8286 length:480 start_codon:yes stop_codon:yes gene_type:complete
MHFKATVNSEIDFDLTAKDLETLDIISNLENTYHILHQNESHQAEIIHSDFNEKLYSVKINNNLYSISISNPLDLLIKDMGFTLNSTKHISLIKAPMPGLILDINVSVGQTVNENDALLILEAMKMENVLTSPRQGIIKSISVKKGDAVEKNTLLIEFE